MHKPPLLLLHEDIESVEFCRQGGGGGASTKTFDLAIRDRNDQVGPSRRRCLPSCQRRGGAAFVEITHRGGFDLVRKTSR